MSPTRALQCLLFFALCIYAAAGSPKSAFRKLPALASSVQTNKIRILFIGNSAIYFHNLPGIVVSIAGTGPSPIHIETELIAEGGQTLEGHWLEGRAQKEIRSKPWDFVVLQEQSGLNDELLVSGVSEITGWETYLRYAKMFDAEVKAVGAKTVILSLWKHKDSPVRDQQVLDYASQELARETGAILVPAGAVWHAVEKQKPALQLYSDTFHPTRAASYVFAAAFYSAVFGRDPANLASKAVGTDIDINEQSGTDPAAVLVDLPKDEADAIKKIAYNIVRHGVPRISFPPDVTIPSLPAGQKVTDSDLAGTWTGVETLVSPTPAAFTLTISADASGLLADTRLVLKTPIEEKAIRGGLAGNTLWFENPKGIDDSYIRYRAVLIRGELVGTTEVWQKKHLVAIGSFRAQKARPVRSSSAVASSAGK